ncbi:MAG: hypothetical protein AB1730_01635 [Myxococcota bacterium]|jgi:hypothetical protein
MLVTLALIAQVSAAAPGFPSLLTTPAAATARSASLIGEELRATRAALDSVQPLPTLSVFGGTVGVGAALVAIGFAVMASGRPCGLSCSSSGFAASAILVTTGGAIAIIGLVATLVLAVMNVVRTPERERLTALEQSLEAELREAQRREAARRAEPPVMPETILVPVTVPL